MAVVSPRGKQERGLVPVPAERLQLRARRDQDADHRRVPVGGGEVQGSIPCRRLVDEATLVVYSAR